MTAVAITDLERDVRGILDRIGLGDTVIVLDGQREIAQITAPASHRPFGLCKGEFDVPDGFNEPLPDDVLRAFQAP